MVTWEAVLQSHFPILWWTPWKVLFQIEFQTPETIGQSLIDTVQVVCDPKGGQYTSSCKEAAKISVFVQGPLSGHLSKASCSVPLYKMLKICTLTFLFCISSSELLRFWVLYMCILGSNSSLNSQVSGLWVSHLFSRTIILGACVLLVKPEATSPNLLEIFPMLILFVFKTLAQETVFETRSIKKPHQAYIFTTLALLQEWNYI